MTVSVQNQDVNNVMHATLNTTSDTEGAFVTG